MTRGKRGGVKRGESNLASNQFPKCSHSPEHPETFTESSREEKGEGEEEEKRRSSREERWGEGCHTAVGDWLWIFFSICFNQIGGRAATLETPIHVSSHVSPKPLTGFTRGKK